MIWKSIRHSLISDLLTWIVFWVFAFVFIVLIGAWGAFGIHFSIPSPVYNLAMFGVFVRIYLLVSRRL